MEIGFIGLGNMGAPMARNLAAAGHAVTGFDVAGVDVEGVAAAASAAAAAAGRDAVVTMLPDGAILRRVYDEIVPVAPPGAVLDRLLDRRRRERPRRRGAGRGRRPGGRRRAGLGRGRRCRGGHADLHGRRHRRQPSSRRDRCSRRWARARCIAAPSGTGQAAKICNNMILGVSMIGVCEAFALAEQARARPARALRRGLDLLRRLLVGDELLPGARASARPRPPTTTTARASPPS